MLWDDNDDKNQIQLTKTEKRKEMGREETSALRTIMTREERCEDDREKEEHWQRREKSRKNKERKTNRRQKQKWRVKSAGTREAQNQENSINLLIKFSSSLSFRFTLCTKETSVSSGCS